MARIGKFTVKVNVDKTIEELAEMGALVNEIVDLVPDWSRMEAEQLQDEYNQKLKSLIYADKTN